MVTVALSTRSPAAAPSAPTGAPIRPGGSPRLGPRWVWGVLFAIAVLVVTSAHVGSPDTWFSGDAGPYRLLVHVRSPAVIPGMAPLEVRVEGAPPDEVLASVDPREGEAPSPPVRALPARGEPGTFRAQLSVAAAGPSSITVQARGARGEGAAVVSVTFLPIQRLQLTRPMALGLALVATVLLGGLVAGVGAAVRDLSGAGPSSGGRRSARVAMGATAALIAVGLVWGKRWWDAQERAYLASLFRPLTAAAEVTPAPAGPEILLRVTDEAWGEGGRGDDGALIPDHGKLMHMFVIAEDRETFAHLHPSTPDSVSFHVALPPLRAGRYRVFADVTRESGLAQTITAPLEVPAEEGYGPASDEDDSWTLGAATGDVRAVLADGSLLRWERDPDPVVAGAPAPLRFVFTDSAGVPLPIEPYMGMLAHAVVLRDDDSVFVHLHPTGTVSAAAQLALSMRAVGDTTSDTQAPGVAPADAAPMGHGSHEAMTGAVRIPYAFPSAGRYNVWVQLKHEGRVLTGAFVVEVAAAGARPSV